MAKSRLIHLLHGLETYGAQVVTIVALLESDDAVSGCNFDCVPATTVTAFYFVNKFAVDIPECKLDDMFIVCSHLDRFNGPVFREVK